MERTGIILMLLAAAVLQLPWTVCYCHAEPELESVLAHHHDHDDDDPVNPDAAGLREQPCACNHGGLFSTSVITTGTIVTLPEALATDVADPEPGLSGAAHTYGGALAEGAPPGPADCLATVVLLL